MFDLGATRWPEVERGPRRLLVVPLGSLEQHGPHLPMDTDTRIAVAVAAHAIASHAGAERDGVGLAPPITIGASGEHAAFPGTLSIGTQALTLLLVELGRHASLHWPAMLLVNGHGGNAPAVHAAVRQLRAEGRDCHAWHAGLPKDQLAAAGLDACVADPHAGRFETSLLLALAPALVRLDLAAAGDTRPLATIMPVLRSSGVRAASPNGVLGDPSGASADEGRALLGLLVASLLEAIEAAT
jgi:mycofactocin system creatininase family protein